MLGFPTKPASQATPTPDGPTTQDWLPIQNILDGVLMRVDGTLVAGLIVQPMNLSLMAQSEQHRVVSGFRTAMDRLTVPWQMISVFRPVDLAAYRQSLAAQADLLPQGIRRQVLNEYQRWVLNQAQGQATERQHAILISRYPTKGASDELRKVVRDFGQDLSQIEGLHWRILDNSDWYRLVQTLFSDSEDSSGPGRLPPVYDEGDDLHA